MTLFPQAGTRVAKLTALGIGVAFMATACGGSSTPTATESSATGSAAGIACPAPEAGGGAAASQPAETPSVPPSTTTTDTPLRIGSLLPTTGSLAFLGPPEIAGVNLGIEEVNKAGGVLGKPVEVIHRDSGDTKTDIATQSTSALLGQGVSAIIGAASSGVSKTVINQITGAGVIQFSPANTSPDFTTWDDKGLYWRTAPSDVLQGKVLGNYMATCGAQTVGMIVLNDAYGTGLASNIKSAFEAAGGQVVAEELFNEGDTQFSSQVDKVIAAKPDAIALITFDQAKSIVPLMTGKGVKPTQMFLVDGNTSDYSKDFQPGTLKGARGTIPGTFAQEEFKKKLLAIDPALKDYSYAGESYDAVNLIALAAESAKSTKGVDIAAKLKEVSEGGEKCTSYAACVTLIREGKDADYDGQSGPVSFSDAGDPTEAYIGIYEYQDDNKYTAVKEEFGKL
ncbi:amino acid ABC transporter substrate-binding protein [Pseudarthrobacter phenanthrenivorans]|jgi:branched-chain amino acid transport system substrate-binding protein|uniref:Amino acid ABC transporter substrate-binding protein n=2 Tax=Pseudarthrobacter phenanthrenivorans TaxID=361575 RepID=A0A3B0FTE9_PSEPS|nr:ABC transporter substrate-binding protein [Pseudarthrobacter phenanthrenivorans]RKO24952.1 amino acid ABC transporter substrate-binding protein [Pseudarthrobacter phenanthrenivorans]TPV51566.1 amino acid ABC transporter substrate-binding protein [Pseudarthrobacter phenanthrenivorans]